MPVVLVARAGFEHRPADDVIGPGRLLVDQELHLHVDPAVIALEPIDFGDIAQIGAVHFWRGCIFAHFRHGAFGGLCQRCADFLRLRSHVCPPRRR
jgi:hypothetical protein